MEIDQLVQIRRAEQLDPTAEPDRRRRRIAELEALVDLADAGELRARRRPMT